jgi:hypothetical protein
MVDDMTNEKWIENKYEKLGTTKNGGTPMYLRVKINYSLHQYLMVLWVESTNIDGMDDINDVYLKFANDSVAKIRVLNTGKITHYNGESFTQGSQTTIWARTVKAHLSPDVVKLLQSIPVAKIRCGSDYVVKESNWEVIPNMLTCIDAHRKH